ncbi:hypothetical protein Clacol_009718 [Clathrus columnatus]|uniref:Fungal-type protein kinase domain-containing protein n=1 Tax=Clathrus columnatus TaxID=1419009 RepID=A0AAV5ARP3_9AGAM|nr:hypothetical protein Clacol_009718 [Clathrus columnatus]
MAYFPGYGYTSSETSSSDQYYAGRHKPGYYNTQDVPSVIKRELESKLEFDQSNVDDELVLVKQVRRKLENDESFVKPKDTLDELRERAEKETEAKLKEGNTADTDYDEDKMQSNEKGMMEPLNQIFNCIIKFAMANDNERARQYDRKWLAGADKTEVISTKGKREWEILWQHRTAFIEVKATIAQGPKPAQENTVKAIVSQAADYARLHLCNMSPIPTLLLGLLIFGRQFCVAIFDRDGVQLFPITDLWDNLDILIRIDVERQYGKCQLLLANRLQQTAWRQTNCLSESAIMQRIQEHHDGLVQYSQVFLPSSGPIASPKIITVNLRNQTRHAEGDTTILHRLIFKTVGRPIWEFDSYLEFFLAIKTALNAHKFLADQHILHLDISAGDVLLSSNPNAPASQKGFLTDLEFAQIDDETLETKNIIPVPSLFNPNRVRQMTVPITRTHTSWTSPPRGAVLTGTIQFMA